MRNMHQILEREYTKIVERSLQRNFLKIKYADWEVTLLPWHGWLVLSFLVMLMYVCFRQ